MHLYLHKPFMFTIHTGHLLIDTAAHPLMDGKRLMYLSSSACSLHVALGCFPKLGGSGEDQDHTSGWRIWKKNQTVIWLSQHLMRTLHMHRSTTLQKLIKSGFASSKKYTNIILISPRYLVASVSWLYSISAVKTSHKAAPHISNNMRFLQGANIYQPNVRSGVIQCNWTQQPCALQPWAYRSCSTWECREPEYQHISGQTTLYWKSTCQARHQEGRTLVSVNCHECMQCTSMQQGQQMHTYTHTRKHTDLAQTVKLHKHCSACKLYMFNKSHVKSFSVWEIDLLFTDRPLFN